jgi:hypothetical protein
MEGGLQLTRHTYLLLDMYQKWDNMQGGFFRLNRPFLVIGRLSLLPADYPQVPKPVQKGAEAARLEDDEIRTRR